MSIRPQCTRIALTYYQEGLYGYEVADNHIDKLFEPNEPILIDLSQTRIDDAEVIKGHELPQETDLDIIIAQDVQIPFSFPASVQLLGLLYALALGGYSVTGAGDPYTHENIWLEACTTDLLPSTSWILGLLGDTASYLQVKGVVMNELKLSLDKVGRLNITGTAICDGTLTEKPSFSFPTTLAGSDWLFTSTCDFKIDGTSHKTSAENKLRTFDFTINNNLDVADGRSNVITADKYLSTLRFGKRDFSLNARFDGHQGDDMWQHMVDEDVMEIDINIPVDSTAPTGDGIYFNFPKVKIATIKPTFDGIRDVLDVQFKVFYDDTDETPVTVTVINDVAVYLTADAT